MKRILIAAVLLVFIGCNREYNDNVVTSKSFFTYNSNPLPNGICRFVVNNIEFMDSCNKYHVLDTIKPHTLK